MAVGVDAFRLPGYETKDALPGTLEKSDAAVPTYKIPPVFWIFALGITGYILLRWKLAD